MKNERRMDRKASNYLLILSFPSFSSIHMDNFEAFGFPIQRKVFFGGNLLT